jgi:uncharacterized protein YbjQ (UPF0145 family)
MYVTTTNDLPGFRVTRHIGLVRGVTVRSRNAISDAIGGVQSMLGGRVGAYVKLAEAGRQEAYDELVKHAEAHGANAILAVRYDATEIMPGAAFGAHGGARRIRRVQGADTRSGGAAGVAARAAA